MRALSLLVAFTFKSSTVYGSVVVALTHVLILSRPIRKWSPVREELFGGEVLVAKGVIG